MNKLKVNCVFVLFCCWIVAAGWGNVPAVRAQTGSPTATADAEGFVRVIVQQGDTLWTIAARAGLSLDDLLELNRLSDSATISPGQSLIVGFFPPTPTPVPLPTATPLVPPTATVVPMGELCMSAFADFNQNGIQEDGEILLAGVRIDVGQNGTVIQNHLTSDSQIPFCFLVSPGDYEVQRLVEGEETLTTAPSAVVVVENAGKTNISFGNVPPLDLVLDPTPTPVPDEQVSPPLFAGNSWVGIMLLLFAGITLVIGIALLFIPTAITIPRRY